MWWEIRKLEERTQELEDARNWLVWSMVILMLTLIAKYPNSSPELIDSAIAMPLMLTCFFGVGHIHNLIDTIKDKTADIIWPRQITIEY